MVYFITAIVWGIIWGIATKTVINNKGYDENWFWWGFFFGFVALIVAACKPENRSWYDDDATSSLISSVAEERRTEQTISNGGWKCRRCGRINPSYTGTCGCGISKSENEAALAAKAKRDNELENLQKLKSYKDLLDSGVITQEEFDKKKEELLNM